MSLAFLLVSELCSNATLQRSLLISKGNFGVSLSSSDLTSLFKWFFFWDKLTFRKELINNSFFLSLHKTFFSYTVPNDSYGFWADLHLDVHV